MTQMRPRAFVLLGCFILPAWLSENANAQEPDCIAFSSHQRLMAGESFSVKLTHGLKFSLADDRDGSWAIVVGPVEEPFVNFFDLTPPLQTRPHAYIGRSYMEARESVSFPRQAHFVVTRRDYDEVARTIRDYDASVSLATIGRLARGRLFLKVNDYSLVPTPFPDSSYETLEWITFSGEICIPPD